MQSDSQSLDTCSIERNLLSEPHQVELIALDLSCTHQIKHTSIWHTHSDIVALAVHKEQDSMHCIKQCFSELHVCLHHIFTNEQMSERTNERTNEGMNGWINF